MHWRRFFANSDIRILLYLRGKNPTARYSHLLRKVVKTRSVLSTTLHDLRNRGFIERLVDDSTPPQTRYRLTRRGRKITDLLIELRKAVL